MTHTQRYCSLRFIYLFVKYPAAVLMRHLCDRYTVRSPSQHQESQLIIYLLTGQDARLQTSLRWDTERTSCEVDADNADVKDDCSSSWSSGQMSLKSWIVAWFVLGTRLSIQNDSDSSIYARWCQQKRRCARVMNPTAILRIFPFRAGSKNISTHLLVNEAHWVFVWVRACFCLTLTLSVSAGVCGGSLGVYCLQSNWFKEE